MKSAKLLLLVLAALGLQINAPARAGTTRYETLQVTSGDQIPYAVHLPNGFDKSKVYPVLVGPGDAEKGKEAGYYWQSDMYSHGWIIVDAQIWSKQTEDSLDELLDELLRRYKVEGDKFHTVCWSANSAGIFDLAIRYADRFYSIAGMAGNPRNLSKEGIAELKKMKVQFVVGENDPYWQRSARDAHEKLKAAGVATSLEIVPNGEHVMTELIGKGFMQRMERMRAQRTEDE